MKKLIACTCIALAMIAGAEMKLGVVSLEVLIKNHPSHASNKTLVKSTADDYRKKMETHQEQMKSLMEEGAKVQSDSRNPMLSAGAKADLQKKWEGIQRKAYAAQQEMRADDQRFQEELADLQQRLFKIEKRDVEAKIGEFAKSEGYDLIVDIAACGFAKPELEVTDAVLKRMGIDPAKKAE